MADKIMHHVVIGSDTYEIVDEQGRATAATNTQDISSLKEDFHEYHSELGAGYADQLVSSIENEDSVPYNFRKVPYDATLEYVDGIVGCDVVANQFVVDPECEHANNWGALGGTNTVANNELTYTVTSIGSEYFSNQVYQTGYNVPSSHILYIAVDTYAPYNNGFYMALRTNSVGQVNVGISKVTPTPNAWTNFAKVTKLNNVLTDIALYWSMNTRYAVGDSVKLRRPQVRDLTAMFGSPIADYIYSLETATAGAGVAWLKEHFSKIIDSEYIAHNPGELVHVSGLSAHKTVGFNQWNEEWEVYGTSGQIRSKSRIKLISGATYYAKTPPSGITLYYKEKETDVANIGEVGVINNTFVVPTNTHYAVIYTGVGYGTTYKNDICINLSDPTRNGTYEPYEAHEYPLDSAIDLHGILKLDAQNNLYADGDVYSPSGEVNHRYGVVDLGTLNWSFVSASDWNCFSAQISDKANGVRNFMCAKYVHGTVYGTDTDKIIIGNASSAYIYIRDTSYTDAASFKASLSGVYLVYEKQTASTEQAEPYTATQICDPNGTEEFISTTVAPVGHVTRYPENLRKKIEGLPWNFATLIAPTEGAYVATRNYTTGSLFIVNNVLYKATANIANGATITPNSNCTATTLAEVISAIQ